ncbi:hypothetical protein Bbelb_277680 [Branchiostoma belcheri]|nr:hypothetical protein Bbelb_277680 [Branchiostoma belcheri]
MRDIHSCNDKRYGHFSRIRQTIGYCHLLADMYYRLKAVGRCRILVEISRRDTPRRLNMSGANLSAVVVERGKLKLEEGPIPQPGRHEVQLAMHSVGICGTDVHVLTEGSLGQSVLTGPTVSGHEASGTVRQVGEGVTHLAVGDRVAIEPCISCRYCTNCKAGRYYLCPRLKACSIPPVHGLMCRYKVHPADLCYKVFISGAGQDRGGREGGRDYCRLQGLHQRSRVTTGSVLSLYSKLPWTIQARASDDVIFFWTIGLVCLLAAKAMGAAEGIIAVLCVGCSSMTSAMALIKEGVRRELAGKFTRTLI